MCASDCVARGILSKTSKSIDVTVLHEHTPMFIVTCFSTQELFKKTSREGRINRIKPKEKKQTRINTARRNTFGLPGVSVSGDKELAITLLILDPPPKAQIPYPCTCCPHLNICLLNSEPLHLRVTVSHCK